MILCCKCGVSILPCLRNMCIRCINNTTNILSHIKTNICIETCRGCERYHCPPKSWRVLSWGSKDLLMFLLARNKTLSKLNIVDTNFIYTEEHSKKIKAEIVVLESGIEQTAELTFNIRNKQCTDCMRAEAQQHWRVLVQLRQRPHHKRTFLYLEQLIINHKAHIGTTNIKECKDGIDFYFQDKMTSKKFLEFLGRYCGIRTIQSSRLISEDEKNNTANRKLTFSVEMMPFCTDDLVHVPSDSLGIGHFLVVSKVRNTVDLYNPETGGTVNVNSKVYFSKESDFRILMRSSSFRRYRVVFSRAVYGEPTEITLTDDDVHFYETVTCLKVRDNDIVMCYDLRSANLSTDISIPREVLIVRVCNDIDKEVMLRSGRLLDAEFRYFLDDISEDKQMVASLCVYDPKSGVVEDFSKLNIQ